MCKWLSWGEVCNWNNKNAQVSIYTNAALIANNSVQAVKQNDDESRALQYILAALSDNALVIILILENKTRELHSEKCYFDY